MGLMAVFKNKNVRNSSLYTFFSFLNNGISFILLLILADFLIPKEYGFLNLYNTFVQIISILISLGTNSFIANAFFQKTKEELKQVILISFLVTAIVLIVLVVLILSLSAFPSLIGIPKEFLLISVFVCFFQAFANVNLDIWRLEEKPLSYGLFSLSIALLNFIITFILIIVYKEGWKGRAFAQLIVSVLFFFISILFLTKRGYLNLKKVPKCLIKETLFFGLPLVPHMASFWLKQGMDRYIINFFHGQTAVGYYSIAMNLAAIITIFGTAFNSNNSVYIFKKISAGGPSLKLSLKRHARIMYIVFGGIALAVGFFAHLLIKFYLFKYDNSIVYILPLCIGAYIQCIYLLWVNYLFYYKRTKLLMFITFGTAILQIALSLWLTRFSVLYTAWLSAAVVLLTVSLVTYCSITILNKRIK